MQGSQGVPAGPGGCWQVPLALVPDCCLSPGPFPVRLAGGPGRCAGRVEVQHSGQWGTVCDDDWGLPDAAVVCRQLGCGDALAAPPGAWFGEGLGPIWLNGLRCRGTEERLVLCRHRGWRPHVCAHEEDASAVCSGGLQRVGGWVGG